MPLLGESPRQQSIKQLGGYLLISLQHAHVLLPNALHVRLCAHRSLLHGLLSLHRTVSTLQPHWCLPFWPLEYDRAFLSDPHSRLDDVSRPSCPKQIFRHND